MPFDCTPPRGPSPGPDPASAKLDPKAWGNIAQSMVFCLALWANGVSTWAVVATIWGSFMAWIAAATVAEITLRRAARRRARRRP